MGDWHNLKSSDGYRVPLALYEPKGTVKAVFLMLPALGVKAKFYGHVAKGLADHGVATVLFEQRGHGESDCKPSKNIKVGYQHYLDIDLPLAMDWTKKRFQGVPFFVGGHSLGAHMSNYIAAARGHEIAGLVHLACVFPYYGFYPRKEAVLLNILCAAIPPLTYMLGYYPGKMFGFGGKEHRQVMLDWREWALTGNYDFGDIKDVEDRMAAYRGKLLSISFEDDHLASEKALRKPNAVMSSSEVKHVHLTRKEQGDYIGHFDWAKKPVGAVNAINEWIDTCLT
ncbi:MAG: alpha/beta fold hydrolase [Kordiimonas sp.]